MLIWSFLSSDSNLSDFEVTNPISALPFCILYLTVSIYTPLSAIISGFVPELSSIYAASVPDECLKYESPPIFCDEKPLYIFLLSVQEGYVLSVITALVVSSVQPAYSVAETSLFVSKTEAAETEHSGSVNQPINL